MIHYHGTPISGTTIDLIRFITGRHGLVSFAYKNSLSIVAECSQSFVLDNGAYTSWKKGKTFKFIEYCMWVEKWCKHPGFDWALIPDKIDGTEQENDDLLEPWLDYGLGTYGVPIWHFHESLERLEILSNTWSTIALGSSGEFPTPGADIWWNRIKEIFSVLCDKEGRPNCKLHGLRMLDPKIFSKIPLSSADSTNAGVNAGSTQFFGRYTPPNSWQRAEIIAERIEQFNSAALWQNLE